MKLHVPASFPRVLIPAIATLVAIAVILLGINIWDHHRSTNDPQTDRYLSTDSEKPIVYMDGEPLTPKSDIQTVLFLGIDTFDTEETDSYINNHQADVLMLLVMDKTARQYSVIPINRDTIATFEMLGVTGESAGDITAQIALSHAYGSGGKDSVRNTVHAVSDLLYGTVIDHYVSLQMNGISVLNDAVGGVEVELLDDFTMLDSSYTKGQTVRLQGAQALTYVRERGALEDSSNISRMKRQEQYLTAWKDAFVAMNDADDTAMASMMSDVSEYMLTDLTASQMNTLFNNIDSYSSNGFMNIEGESVLEDGFMAFYPNEEALRRLVTTVFYEPTSVE